MSLGFKQDVDEDKKEHYREDLICLRGKVESGCLRVLQNPSFTASERVYLNTEIRAF